VAACTYSFSEVELLPKLPLHELLHESLYLIPSLISSMGRKPLSQMSQNYDRKLDVGEIYKLPLASDFLLLYCSLDFLTLFFAHQAKYPK